MKTCFLLTSMVATFVASAVVHPLVKDAKQIEKRGILEDIIGLPFRASGASSGASSSSSSSSSHDDYDHHHHEDFHHYSPHVIDYHYPAVHHHDFHSEYPSYHDLHHHQDYHHIDQHAHIHHDFIKTYPEVHSISDNHILHHDHVHLHDLHHIHADSLEHGIHHRDLFTAEDYAGHVEHNDHVFGKSDILASRSDNQFATYSNIGGDLSHFTKHAGILELSSESVAQERGLSFPPQRTSYHP